ncbi:MAG: enoyl-CoA hydratase-related protein [Dermatophilaceae bacterium]
MSSGEKVFAAGADIVEMESLSHTDMPDYSVLLQDVTRALAPLPRPTVAAITGYALCGGCEVALACDFRVAVADATLGQPEVLDRAARARRCRSIGANRVVLRAVPSR